MARIDGLMLGTNRRPLKVRMDGMNYLVTELHDLIRDGLVRPTVVLPGTAPNGVPVDRAIDAGGRKTLVARTDPQHAIQPLYWNLPCPPMKVLAFGDSIQWGQGLRPTEKIYRLVANELSIANNGTEVGVMNLAGSGSLLGTAPGAINVRTRGPGGEDISGEIPDLNRTVPLQIANATSLASDATVDIVLVNGGINDIGVRNILRYVDNSPSLRAGTAALGAPLTTVLHMLLGRYPNAIIVVTGYYPIVSPRSAPNNPSKLSLAVARMGGSPVTTNPPSLARRMWIISNCALFSNDSDGAFSSAVSAVNATLPNPRVYFMSPRFGDDDALLAPASQLWGVEWNDAAQDPIRNPRRDACKVATKGHPVAYLLCRLASVGHPTPGGAASYASQIFSTFFNDPLR